MALRGARRSSLLAAAAVSALVIAGAGSALASGSSGSVRVGSAPPLASMARAAGVVPAARKMHLTLVLKPRDPAALAAYARAVSTPGSSEYHAYLSPAQFATRFGASRAEVQAVQASMRAHQLSVGQASSNRLAVPVSGSAGQVERAFSLSFRRVTTPGGRRAIVASAAPAFDRGIAGDVQAVIGLTTIAAPRPLLVNRRPSSAGVSLRPHAVAHAASTGPAACGQAKATAATEGAYTADQIASSYGFADLYANGSEGQGQTIAIYELESYDPSDIAAYQACYGTAAKLANVPVDGGSGESGPGSGEAALDIEQAIGLAPKASFLIYEAPNSGTNSPGSGPYDALNLIVSQDRAHVVSMSWGQCEQVQGSNVLSAESTLFEEAATQGQSVIAATGDNGSEDCNNPSAPDNQLAVDDPGSQPFVTGVGGTTLASAGPPPAETVWNHNNGVSSGPLVAQGGAGGGGPSHAWDMPGYQSNSPRSLNVIGRNSSGSSCGNSGGYCRQVPDVAADADPAKGYLFYWNGSGANPGMPRGWQAVGGTSAGSPLWAALVADADSSSACHGSAIGFANPALYRIAAMSYTSYFNDVVSGNNDFTGANNGLYSAGGGYDMASGLGTPKAGALAGALCAESLQVNNPGPQVSTVGQRVSLPITTSALSGAKLHFYASQLPTGLTISPSTGRITGRPKRTGKWSSGVAALDQNLSLRGAFFSWQIEGAPTLTAASLSGVAGGRPKLVFALGAGHAALPLKTITIRLSSGLRFGPVAGRVTLTGLGGRRLAFAARLVSGRLRITLAALSWWVRVTINPAAIKASGALAGDVRRHRSPAVTLTVQTADSSGHGAAARARIKPRS